MCELHETLLPDSDLSSKLVVVLPIEFDEQLLVLPPGLPLVGSSLGKGLSGVPEAPLELAQLPDPVKLLLVVKCLVFPELLQLLAGALCMYAFGNTNIAVMAIIAPKANVSLFVCSRIPSKYKRINGICKFIIIFRY